MPRTVFISLALLLPCFWNPRIQAGDLSSHLYNAWLGLETLAGRAPGLALVFPSTNVLFDRLLLWLMQVGGPLFAERIAVPFAVLLLFWSGVAWIRAATGLVPWFLMPCLAMLAYGWTFHMGFFNFYLATGMAFLALALAWKPSPARLLAAALVLVAGYPAHAIPVLWAAAVLVYVFVARKVPEARTPWLAAGAIAAVGLVRLVLDSRYRTMTTSQQVLEMTATDQVWVYGLKYLAVSILLAAFWGFLLLRLSHLRGERALIRSLPFQLCLVMSVALYLFPTRIEIPSYRMALTFITERMTLPFGFLVCLLLVEAKPLQWQKWTFAGLCALFFSFVYADTRALDRWEAEVRRAVEYVPRGQRLVSAIHDPVSRTLVWPHALERACIGRCYSYQNYEPGSAAFQVQSRRENGIVLHSPADAARVTSGAYIVRESDLPVSQLLPCGAGRLCVVPLRAGETVKAQDLAILPLLW
ncbi:MAG: hypothetical protein ACKV22_20355 [Bryobacteraceae bacterium]